MDFIYLDVWYQDAWETRQIADEINSLGWRFSTEFSAEGEYDSTWQHWSTDAAYGGATSKDITVILSVSSEMTREILRY